MVLYDVWFANDLDGLELALGKRMVSKGTCQKRFSGFFPLRGGGGYPPIPLGKKSAKKHLFLAKKH